jgi:alanine racemase
MPESAVAPRHAVTVSIDLSRIRQNAESILRATGVPLIAVVKADAYGLGASEVAGAIGDLVDAFYVFDAAEAVRARLWEIAGRRIIALNADWNDPNEFLSRHIQPVVWTRQRAAALRAAHPVLSIDTGQQRFACPVSDAPGVCDAGDCGEIMTHAITLSQVHQFANLVQDWGDRMLFLHAAGSALLDKPEAWFNAVRPGLALYQGAVRVCTRLVDVRDSAGPAGYSGFICPRFGVILAGYSNGIRPGPCRLNGQSRRVLEVGMQSAFVEAGRDDSVGDEVELLANTPGIDLPDLAGAWGSSQQEVLVRLCEAGKRNYR